MKLEQQEKFTLLRVPEVKLTEKVPAKKKVVAGLIDASGSMGSYWTEMVKFWNQCIAQTADFLITFSHIAKLEQNTILSTDLKKHGGGMTNIYAAFESLENRLMSVPQDASITIVFISDGQDTVSGDKLGKKMSQLRGGMGRDITMLCLGIQSGFPTKMAMQIRQLYHTGDEKIPALYLIEYASEKAFFNKFESMASCFKTISTLTPKKEFFPLLKEYPWQECGKLSHLKQNQWIMVDTSVKILKVLCNEKEEVDLEVGPVIGLSLQELVDCFRGWVQKVQLLSMDNSKVKETSAIAEHTIEIITKLTLAYSHHHSLYILTSPPQFQKESFKSRASSLANKNTGVRIKWYLDELKVIAKGVGIGMLSEYDAAKRIGIGTITGKYHQKALALKGITVKQFQKIKEEFVEIFKRTKLSQKPSLQQCSIFTLQNQKEIFQQPDFLEGLDLCKSQYDLVQTFPIVGSSLKLKRYDGSLINPWKVQVQSLAKTHKTIDSMYLANNGNKYELKVGDNQVQSINAVLPIFAQNDEQMSQLINSRLFRLAMGFMVVQNIDTYHDEAYLALLGSTFVYLLKQPQSQWKANLLNDIFISIKATYGQTPEFQAFISSILVNPFNLFSNVGKEDHVDITKVLIVTFYIYKMKLLNEKEMEHLTELALVHYCQKTWVQNEFKMSRVAEVVIKAGNSQKGVQLLKEEKLQEKEEAKQQKIEMSLIKNDKQLQKAIDEELTTFLDPNKLDLTLSEKIFLHTDDERRVTYPHISSFYRLLTGKQLQKGQMLIYWAHYLKGKNQQNYGKQIQRTLKAVKLQAMKGINLKQISGGNSKKIKEVKKMIYQKYVNRFRDAHFGILPLTKAKFIEICNQMHINSNILKYNQSTGLISNACMSKYCKYFLEPLNAIEFREHMRLWHHALPAKFHMRVTAWIKEGKKDEQIVEKLWKQGLIVEKKHLKGKEFVKSYIQKIRAELK